jgi:hypothetical protein
MFKTSKKSKNILALCLGLFIGVSLATSAVAFGPHAYAADAAKDDKAKDNICKTNPDGSQSNPDPSKPCIPDPNALKDTPDAAAKACTGSDCSGLINKYVNPFIKLLTWIVGIAVVISIIVGGIQYASAGGDPGKVVAARKRITNSIVGLLAYLFMFAFLQWLLPGGIV